MSRAGKPGLDSYRAVWYPAQYNRQLNSGHSLKGTCRTFARVEVDQ
jgi:hypothetical protein